MPSEEVLQTAAVRLVKAMALYRVTPTTSAADRVIGARLAVKEAFIAAGWRPPKSTLQAMERDRLLLQEHAGALDATSERDQPDVFERRRSPGRREPALPVFSCSRVRVSAG